MKNSFSYTIYDFDTNSIVEENALKSSTKYVVKIQLRLSKSFIETYFDKYILLHEIGNTIKKVVVIKRYGNVGSVSGYFRILTGHGFSSTCLDSNRLVIQTGQVNGKPTMTYDEHDLATIDISTISYSNKHISKYLENCKICLSLMSENQEKVRNKDLMR